MKSRYSNLSGFSLTSLQKSGINVGLSKRILNSKMTRFVSGHREGYCFFNLYTSSISLRRTLLFLHSLALRGKRITFVSNDIQNKSLDTSFFSSELSKAVGKMGVVSPEWVGGSLTNRSLLSTRFFPIKVSKLQCIFRSNYLENVTLHKDFLLTFLRLHGHITVDFTSLVKYFLVNKHKVAANKLKVHYFNRRKGRSFRGAFPSSLVCLGLSSSALSESCKLKIPSVGFFDSSVGSESANYVVPFNVSSLHSISFLYHNLKKVNI